MPADKNHHAKCGHCIFIQSVLESELYTKFLDPGQADATFVGYIFTYYARMGVVCIKRFSFPVFIFSNQNHMKKPQDSSQKQVSNGLLTLGMVAAEQLVCSNCIPGLHICDRDEPYLHTVIQESTTKRMQQSAIEGSSFIAVGLPYISTSPQS